ncbi:hypothetical protein CAOG_02040 [Capsaspora owczarzaki ATCC 30864]|uniref:Chaperonin 10 n=1 Tax=Capsaspora owczarzaki (strain ATCC 30864) TaxID=595528 RepID=A0A0D2WKI6_CAPO3|nr:hypothetical protein CAOG_02040 [Capsaspora owczarzaki ATCC 30864]KJE90795.1 hypothetical protein CAOG_002040 [Capsaspora owczarzaki ATCC 30864]|eukprot:XP_004348790.1 hypothetical protein CAOG_02040 [Capsaspora owczarzaki ATCC 30864]
MAANVARRLKPLFDRVLVERLVAPQKTKSGILLPESAVPALNEGVVIAVGPGARDQAGNLIPPSVKIGEKVLLPEFGGNKIKLDDKEFTLYRDVEILGVLH